MMLTKFDVVFEGQRNYAMMQKYCDPEFVLLCSPSTGMVSMNPRGAASEDGKAHSASEESSIVVNI